jgi:hypothetical protein
VAAAVALALHAAVNWLQHLYVLLLLLLLPLTEAPVCRVLLLLLLLLLFLLSCCVPLCSVARSTLLLSSMSLLLALPVAQLLQQGWGSVQGTVACWRSALLLCFGWGAGRAGGPGSGGGMSEEVTGSSALARPAGCCCHGDKR